MPERHDAAFEVPERRECSRVALSISAGIRSRRHLVQQAHCRGSGDRGASHRRSGAMRGEREAQNLKNSASPAPLREKKGIAGIAKKPAIQR